MADTPSISPSFWEVLETSGRSLRLLCRKLEKLTKKDLERYYLEYAEAKESVNPCSWEECGQYLSADCSEDHGDDFAAWVVMQGREFYEQVLANPEEVQDYLAMFERGGPQFLWDDEVDHDEYRGYQRADSVASPIYKLRFGKDLYGAVTTVRGSKPADA